MKVVTAVLFLSMLFALLIGGQVDAFDSPLEPPEEDAPSSGVIPQPYVSPLPEIPPEEDVPSPSGGSSANIPPQTHAFIRPARVTVPYVSGYLRMAP